MYRNQIKTTKFKSQSKRFSLKKSRTSMKIDRNQQLFLNFRNVCRSKTKYSAGTSFQNMIRDPVVGNVTIGQIFRHV